MLYILYILSPALSHLPLAWPTYVQVYNPYAGLKLLYIIACLEASLVRDKCCSYSGDCSDCFLSAHDAVWFGVRS